MTNYRIALIAIAALFAGACSAAETPAESRAQTGRGETRCRACRRTRPGRHGVAALRAGAAEAASRSRSCRRAPPARALSSNSPPNFATTKRARPPGSLNVKVQMASVDTQDKDRNEMITGADLFDAAKFPASHSTSQTHSRSGRTEASRPWASSRSAISPTTCDCRSSSSPRPMASSSAAKTPFKRLDYGVGQGEWKATDSVGDEVKIEYAVSLVRSRS